MIAYSNHRAQLYAQLSKGRGNDSVSRIQLPHVIGTGYPGLRGGEQNMSRSTLVAVVLAILVFVPVVCVLAQETGDGIAYGILEDLAREERGERLVPGGLVIGGIAVAVVSPPALRVWPFRRACNLSRRTIDSIRPCPISVWRFTPCWPLRARSRRFRSTSGLSMQAVSFRAAGTLEVKGSETL